MIKILVKEKYLVTIYYAESLEDARTISDSVYEKKAMYLDIKEYHANARNPHDVTHVVRCHIQQSSEAKKIVSNVLGNQYD